MAEAWIHTGATGASVAIQVAYAQDALFPFNNNLVFAQAAKEKVWSEADGDPMPGKSVTFTLYQHFDPATGALGETTDPDSVPLELTQKNIVLYEYGNVVTRTSKYKATTFLDNLDPDVVFLIGYNAATSVDLIARAAFDAQTGGTWNSFASGSAVGSVTSTAVLNWPGVRIFYNKLDRTNTPPPRTLAGGSQLWGCIIHPDVWGHLKGLTGKGTFREPKEYADANEILTGEMGANEGFRFQVTNHCKVQILSGASVGSSADVYTTYFYGFQAVGKANGNVSTYVEADGTNGEFTVIISGPYDKLRRKINIGWKSLVGYGEIRTNSLQKYFSGSPLQTQVAQTENG